jgi:hypothetical protein
MIFFLIVAIICFANGLFHSFVYSFDASSAVQVTQLHIESQSSYFYGIFFLLIYYGQKIVKILESNRENKNSRE